MALLKGTVLRGSISPRVPLILTSKRTFMFRGPFFSPCYICFEAVGLVGGLGHTEMHTSCLLGKGGVEAARRFDA